MEIYYFHVDYQFRWETSDLQMNVQQFNAERYFNNSLSFEADCEKLIKKLSFIDRKPLSAAAWFLLFPHSLLLVYTVFFLYFREAKIWIFDAFYGWFVFELLEYFNNQRLLVGKSAGGLGCLHDLIWISLSLFYFYWGMFRS